MTTKHEHKNLRFNGSLTMPTKIYYHTGSSMNSKAIQILNCKNTQKGSYKILAVCSATAFASNRFHKEINNFSMTKLNFSTTKKCRKPSLLLKDKENVSSFQITQIFGRKNSVTFP